jgi:cell wall-associated NlpC family hydrolase
MPANARKFNAAILPIAATALAASTMASTPAQAATPSTAPTMAPQQTLTATYHRPKGDPRIKRALSIMRAQQGDPYSYGSAGPNAFDCSGLVFYATHRAGFKRVPRTSGAQAGYMHRISKRAMKPGDFVFFSSGGHVYHVGMYVGRNRVLHAPYSGARVRTEHIWTSSWFGGTLRGRR